MPSTGRVRRSAALAVLLAVVASCEHDALERVSVRNATDRALALKAFSLTGLMFVDLRLPETLEASEVGAGCTVLQPQASATVEHPDPGQGIVLAVYVDLLTEAGTFGYSHMARWTESELWAAGAAVELTQYHVRN